MSWAPWETRILILLVGVGLYFLYRIRRQEDSYLKKKTSETFSPDLKKEIDEEREINQLKQKKFEEALKQSQKT